jgi:hypothetical protein
MRVLPASSSASSRRLVAVTDAAAARSVARIAELRRTFAALAGPAHAIPAAQLRTALSGVVAPAVAGTLVASMDANGDGSVDAGEFAGAVGTILYGQFGPAARALLAAFGHTAGGRVTAAQFTAWCVAVTGEHTAAAVYKEFAVACFGALARDAAAAATAASPRSVFVTVAAGARPDAAVADVDALARLLERMGRSATRDALVAIVAALLPPEAAGATRAAAAAAHAASARAARTTTLAVLSALDALRYSDSVWVPLAAPLLIDYFGVSEIDVSLAVSIPFIVTAGVRFLVII